MASACKKEFQASHHHQSLLIVSRKGEMWLKGMSSFAQLFGDVAVRRQPPYGARLPVARPASKGVSAVLGFSLAFPSSFALDIYTEREKKKRRKEKIVKHQQ